MFKIGEFSKLGHASTRMLRHYVQLGLLKPSQTDKFTSYRYYTIDQLARLNRIVALKELGFSLEQVAQLLDKEGELSAEKLRGMLTMRRAEIERELRDKHLQLTEVESRLRQIEQEGQPSPYEIIIKSLEPQAIASIRQMVPTMGEMGFFCQKLYTDLIYEGPFDEMTSAVLALLTYVGTHKHVLAGPLRELHLSGPAHEEQGRAQNNPSSNCKSPSAKSPKKSPLDFNTVTTCIVSTTYTLGDIK